MTPALADGVQTRLNRSPRSAAGNPLNERSQAPGLHAPVLLQTNFKNQKNEGCIV